MECWNVETQWATDIWSGDDIVGEDAYEGHPFDSGLVDESKAYYNVMPEEAIVMENDVEQP